MGIPRVGARLSRAMSQQAMPQRPEILLNAKRHEVQERLLFVH
jgi:hypothetical protein